MAFEAFIKNKYYYSLASSFCYAFGLFVLKIYYYGFKKLKVEYTADKPEPNTNIIYVANHKSLNDPPMLAAALDSKISFIAKKELFENSILNFLMQCVSTIKVDREKTDSQTFRDAFKCLASKDMLGAWNLGIFIEGTRSKDPDYLAPPQKGPMMIAKKKKVAVVPVGISYRKEGIIVKVGKAYQPEGDIEEEAWECLEKISELCDYKMPAKQA